jgi:hypothetical protein
MSTTIYTTADEAIEASTAFDAIAKCADTPENIAALKAECSDWTDSHDGYLDFWADDMDSPSPSDKMLWRVRVILR